jgi:energy-coupling factor transporter ATP-binding protein EcfA2
VSSERSRSSADPVRSALEHAVSTLVDAARSVGAANPVVLIDGRSGAGKSTLAAALVRRWPSRGRVQLVALDSLYPGWDGLDEGVEQARQNILMPHAKGVIGVWRRWDWDTGSWAEAHAVDPSLPLVVEGAGSLTPPTQPLADVRVWLDSPELSRRARALERDGDTYRPHWVRWAEQEEQHIVRDAPQSLATHVLAVP